MTKQASKTIIGAFVVGALALAVAAVIVFGGGRFFTEKTPWVLYFDGSVKGLNVGAPVMFRGVKVGSVTDIDAVLDPDRLSLKIPVTIEIDSANFSVVGGATRLERFGKGEVGRRLIERGLRGRLDTQSMVTGQLMVGLDFYPDKPARFVGDGTIPEIPTIPSTMQELSRTLEKLPLDELAYKLTSAVSGIDRAVNSPQIAESIRNLNGALQDIRKLVQNVDSRIGRLEPGIQQTIQDYGKLALDAHSQIGSVASGIEGSLKDIQGLVRNLNGVVTKLDAAVEPLPETLTRVRQIVRQVDDLVGNQRPNIERTLENVGVTSQNIKDLSENAKRDPSGVLFGKPPPPSRRRKK
jgi:paraquat-inducible protein B